MTEREKSTLYPGITWNACLEFLELIDSMKLKSVSLTILAQELGLKSTNTKSFTKKISAAKQYGLIESDHGAVKITSTGRRILNPTTTNTYPIKHACFAIPPLHNKLIAEFDGKALPRLDLFENLLMESYGITKSAKKNAAECFMESAKQLGVIKGGILCYKDADNAESSISPFAQDTDVPDMPGKDDTDFKSDIVNNSDCITQNIPISSGGSVQFSIPIDATEDDLLLVRDIFDVLLKRRFKVNL